MIIDYRINSSNYYKLLVRLFLLIQKETETPYFIPKSGNFAEHFFNGQQQTQIIY